MAEYASVAWHSMLSLEQTTVIERQQNKALQFIYYGIGFSAEKMQKMSGLETLAARRYKACKKFAERCLENNRFSGWFPERPDQDRARRETAAYEKYLEWPAPVPTAATTHPSTTSEESLTGKQ